MTSDSSRRARWAKSLVFYGAALWLTAATVGYGLKIKEFGLYLRTSRDYIAGKSGTVAWTGTSFFDFQKLRFTLQDDATVYYVPLDFFAGSESWSWVRSNFKPGLRVAVQNYRELAVGLVANPGTAYVKDLTEWKGFGGEYAERYYRHADEAIASGKRIAYFGLLILPLMMLLRPVARRLSNLRERSTSNTV